MTDNAANPSALRSRAVILCVVTTSVIAAIELTLGWMFGLLSVFAEGLHTTADLADWQVEMMRPFSDFEFLRQAFTRGERWDVAPERLDRLVSAGRIDEEQRARFAAGGAIGSHLENIQRAEGFKGFNQETVSDIIRRTDPRGEIGA